jgi:hypothetical protein
METIGQMETISQMIPGRLLFDQLEEHEVESYDVVGGYEVLVQVYPKGSSFNVAPVSLWIPREVLAPRLFPTGEEFHFMEAV